MSQSEKRGGFEIDSKQRRDVQERLGEDFMGLAWALQTEFFKDRDPWLALRTRLVRIQGDGDGEGEWTASNGNLYNALRESIVVDYLKTEQ